MMRPSGLHNGRGAASPSARSRRTRSKHDRHAKYCGIFNAGMKGQWAENRGYLELFACLHEQYKVAVDGCPLIAAGSHFNRLAFVEYDDVLARALEQRLRDRGVGPDRALVITGDANDPAVLQDALDFLPRPGLGFCFVEALAEELGREAVVNGDHAKRRNARERLPVIAESEPLELTTRSPGSPAAVRPALALTAAEEVETIRRVLLEAATSTSRETWVTCTCPECGKSFRQEVSVPDHGARIKAVETLLREGLGRVGEAEVVEPKAPTSIAEVQALSWNELSPSLLPVRPGDPRSRRSRRRGAPHGAPAWEPESRAALSRLSPRRLSLSDPTSI